MKRFSIKVIKISNGAKIVAVFTFFLILIFLGLNIVNENLYDMTNSNNISLICGIYSNHSEYKIIILGRNIEIKKVNLEEFCSGLNNYKNKAIKIFDRKEEKCISH